jgi:hypothetical protein
MIGIDTVSNFAKRLIFGNPQQVQNSNTALYVSADLNEAAQNVRAELSSEDKFKSYWRPAYMWSFLAMIIISFIDSFIAAKTGRAAVKLDPEIWNLCTIGMAGYMSMRTVETVVKYIADRMAK